MLIRMADNKDVTGWQDLAKDVAVLFGNPDMPYEQGFFDYINSKISGYEAIVAVDRMSEELLGVIAFSIKNNRISWFAVKSAYRGKGIGTRLLSCVLRQLDSSKDISVITFAEDTSEGLSARKIYENFAFNVVDDCVKDEHGNIRCKMIRKGLHTKRGNSFHYDYKKYVMQSKEENCPPCKYEFMVLEETERIAELDYSYIDIPRVAQGKLFGKCSIIPKLHVINFEDMPFDYMTGFMSDMQKLGNALKKNTGAIKINYEMHSNSMPHLHVHVFPRYLDDEFPSLPINFELKEPSPYESDEEYYWFVKKMRAEFNKG